MERFPEDGENREGFEPKFSRSLTIFRDDFTIALLKFSVGFAWELTMRLDYHYGLPRGKVVQILDCGIEFTEIFDMTCDIAQTIGGEGLYGDEACRYDALQCTLVVDGENKRRLYSKACKNFRDIS